MPDESAKVTDAGNETTGTGDGEMANDDDGTDVRSVVVPTTLLTSVPSSSFAISPSPVFVVSLPASVTFADSSGIYLGGLSR